MTQRRPKLLVVGAFPPSKSTVRGGQISACRALMRPTFTDRFDVRVLDTTQRSNPPPTLFVRGAAALSRMLQLAWMLVTRPPEGVLLFATIGASYVEKGIMALLCRALGVPVAIFLRGGEMIDHYHGAVWHRILMRALLTRARLFLCQGPKWQRFAVSSLGYPISSAPVVPNWAASEDLLQIGRERIAEIEPSTVRLVFVGWVEHYKGINELLEAAAVLAERELDFRLTIVGGGRLEGRARSFVHERSLQRHVAFVGWQSPNEVREILSRSDVFVLPSWAEGMPNALIEAMSCRLACVVTAVGMVPDFLTDGENALIVPPKCQPALTAALDGLIQNPSRRARIANGAFAMAERVFSEKRGVRMLADILAEGLFQVARGAGARGH